MIELSQGIVILQNEVKLKPLQMLQQVQHLIIKKNELVDYQLDQYQSSSLLRQQWFVKNFSFGQLIIIIQNISTHMLKIYQKMKVSRLLLEKIYFNNHLNVKFINLHETEGEIPYDQNHQQFIIQVCQILQAFQEGFNSEEKQINSQLQKKQTQKLIYISNQVLDILKSNQFQKKLQQFIKINIIDYQLNDKLINDKIIDPLKFNQLFLNQCQSKACNLNSDDNQDQKSDMNFSEKPISQNSCVPSELEAQKQKQFKQNDCQLNNHSQNSEDSKLEIDAIQVIVKEQNDSHGSNSEDSKLEIEQTQKIENQFLQTQRKSKSIEKNRNSNQKVQQQSKLFRSCEQNVNIQLNQQTNTLVPPNHSNNSENNDSNAQIQSQTPEIITQSNQIQQIQNKNQNDQKQYQLQESVQQDVEIKCSENYDSEGQFKSNFSVPSKQNNDQNEQSNILKLFNQDLNIKEINDDNFKEKLGKFLIEQYWEVEESKAKQLFEKSKMYYSQYQNFVDNQKDNQDQNQNETEHNQFLKDLREKYLEFLLQIKKTKKNQLFDLKIDDGIETCQNQLNHWAQQFLKYQQQRQRREN